MTGSCVGLSVISGQQHPVTTTILLLLSLSLTVMEHNQHSASRVTKCWNNWLIALGQAWKINYLKNTNTNIKSFFRVATGQQWEYSTEHKTVSRRERNALLKRWIEPFKTSSRLRESVRSSPASIEGNIRQVEGWPVNIFTILSAVCSVA